MKTITRVTGVRWWNRQISCIRPVQCLVNSCCLIKSFSRQSPSTNGLYFCCRSLYIHTIHSRRYLLRYTRVLVCKLINLFPICWPDPGWPVMLLLWNRIAGSFRESEQWRRVLLELVVLEHIYPSVVCQRSRALLFVLHINGQNVFHSVSVAAVLGRPGMIVFLMMSSNKHDMSFA